MEEQVEIKTDDGHTIYGTLNYGKRKKRLIIFAHGLTGNQYEHQYYNAPAFFNDSFETFRFDFYSRKLGARILGECSIRVHAKDLQKVIDYFKKSYSEIFLIGHSLGCPVVLRVNPKEIKKIVLWDPTKGMRTLEDKNCVFLPEIGRYVLKWDKEMLVSKEMIDDWMESSHLVEEIKKIKTPCIFIFAEKNDILSAWEPLVKKAGYPYAIIKGATHVFYEEGTEKELYKHTKEFLKD